jgi:alkylation response protein AidB-like acyl-CoA dehydrogenase
MSARDWNTLSDQDFRWEVRSFIEAEFPAHLRFHPRRIPRWEETRDWYLTLSAKGWLAPHWPVEYGGMGLTPAKLMIFTEEVERWGIPRLYDMGLFMLGPILIRHGTEEQKQFYLPRILAGEHRWAQGYSEPEAGSDLANLRTRAEPTPQGFVITGHKIWTTFLDDATHMFLLARTEKRVRKQDGVSFLLVDLASAGVTRRLIKTLAGYEELGEVFFDGVRVPADALVGGVHQGWHIAKDLLEFERVNNGSPKQGLQALRRLAAFAAEHGLDEDPWFLERFTRLRLDLQDQIAAYRHFSNRVKGGRPIGPEISMLKIWSTETFQRISNLLLELSGELGVETDPATGTDAANGALGQFYNSRPATIYSGSNEIQRNIIAKRVLGLPQ